MLSINCSAVMKFLFIFFSIALHVARIVKLNILILTLLLHVGLKLALSVVACGKCKIYFVVQVYSYILFSRFLEDLHTPHIQHLLLHTQDGCFFGCHPKQAPFHNPLSGNDELYE